MTEATKQRILQLATNGTALAVIATDTGVSLSTVQYALRDAGLARPRGRPRIARFGDNPFRREKKACADRREAKIGCYCIYCRENRLRDNAKEEARRHAHREYARPVRDCRCQHCTAKREARNDAKYGKGLGLTWRCDCAGQPKITGPQCGHCGTVPAWAIPETI